MQLQLFGGIGRLGQNTPYVLNSEMAAYAGDFGGNPSTFPGEQNYAQETQPQELQMGSEDNEWELLYTEDGLHAYWYNNITQESLDVLSHIFK